MHGNNEVTRRRLLTGALGIAGGLGVGGLGVGGCGSSLASGSGPSVQYWNLFGGGDGVRMVDMVDNFKASRPDINFESATLTWGSPYYTKLAMASAGGRAPDVAILHLARMPGFAPGRLLDPFPEDMLAEVGISQDDFLPSIWERCVVDGQIYAIPLDTHPFVMYYNTDICRQIGVLDDTGHLIEVSGEDDLISMWAEAQKASGNYGVVLDAFGVSPWRLWWSMYRQLDGQVLSDDATELIVDDDKALQVLDFMRRLSVVDKVAPAEMYLDGAVALFGSSKVGFLFNGEWEVTTFQTQETPFSMAPFPNVYGTTNRAEADCHTFVLPHQRSRDNENLRAALDYVAYMLKESVYWAAGGHVPAYLPVVKSEEYLSLEPQSRYRDAAENAQLDPIAWFSGSASDMENQAGVIFGAVHAGTSTPEEALKKFKTTVQKMIDTPSPV